MAKRRIVSTRGGSRSEVSQDFPYTSEIFQSISGNGNIPEFLKNYRRNAWDFYKKLRIPTTKEEAWRRTNLRSMPVGEFLLPGMHPSGIDGSVPLPEELLEPLVGEQHGGQIIITPQNVTIKEDNELSELGVVFTDLRTAIKKHPDILERIMGQIVKPGEGKFSAMTSAFAENGILLYVPRGIEVEIPLQSILWGPGSNVAYFDHIMVFLEDGSSATYVHESASPTVNDAKTLHAGIVEIYVGAAANFRFVELQSWGEHVWNISHERARIERDANFDWIFGAVGSKLTKNFSDLELKGQGASGKMSGFYFSHGTQHMDHDTQQNHFAPSTTSDLLFKGALRGHSRSVWQGMIYVAPGAQKTDGYQANRNLVLDASARADSIPGLEILADDVRCTHGATIGKIDPEQVFYLLSRGISKDHAERLIVEGFFDPIMQRIPYEKVRSRFQQAIIMKMNRITAPAPIR